MKKFLIVISVIFLIIVGVIFIKFVMPEVKYSQAIKWLDNISNGVKLTDIEYSKYLTYFEKNSKYKENESNLKKLKYIKAQKLLDEESLDEAIKLYQELDDYENSNKKIEEINELQKDNIYKNAIELYEKGNFVESKSLFEKIVNNYKEKSVYLDNLNKLIPLQGTYISDSNEKDILILDGWNLNLVFSSVNFDYTYKLLGNKIILVNDYGETLEDNTYNILDKVLVHSFVGVDNKNYETRYIYESSNTEIPTYKTKPEPAIGMTKDEVEDSTWGSPSKINKDTYSWGITEQWVYNDRGYIYFENGIVTSISER